MFATATIQPIDMVKVRIQLSSMQGGSTSPAQMVRDIYAAGGVKGFYAGLDSALLRQLVYATLRLGIYFNLSESVRQKNNGGDLSLFQKIGCSLTAGGIGSFIATPCDLTLVRMQADKRPGIPDSERRNYKGAFDAFRRIVGEEGIKGLYVGGFVTMIRAMTLNMWMLVSYDEAKEKIKRAMPSASPTQIAVYASFVSAIFTSVGSLPMDNIKTKLQNQQVNSEGKLPYSGIFDCMKKTVAKEGVTGLWAGLPTFYFRVGPHAIITLLVAETLKKKFI